MFVVTDCEALGCDQTSSEPSCIISVDEAHKVVIAADMVGTFVQESSMVFELLLTWWRCYCCNLIVGCRCIVVPFFFFVVF